MKKITPTIEVSDEVYQRIVENQYKWLDAVRIVDEIRKWLEKDDA